MPWYTNMFRLLHGQCEAQELKTEYDLDGVWPVLVFQNSQNHGGRRLAKTLQDTETRVDIRPPMFASTFWLAQS